MTNKKTTRRALLVSLVVMLLSFTMLLGTTFAWFTDTASVGVNTIQAGTLDIELQMKDEDGDWVNAEGKTLNFKKANTYYGTEALWEPGCTYELPAIRVVNNGTLNAKIMIMFGGVTGDEKLLEAISFKTTLSEAPAGLEKYNGMVWKTLWKGDPYENAAGETGYVEEINCLADWSLAAKDKKVIMADNSINTDVTPAFTISGHMNEDVGNEYQGLKLEGVSVNVVASQMGGEFDSYNNYYDEDAPYPDIVNPARPTDLPVAIVSDADEYENVAINWNKQFDIYPPEGAQLESVYTFTAKDDYTAAQNSPYADWICDYYVSLDRDLGEDQLILGGNYGSYGWIGFTAPGGIAANTATPLLGSVNMTFTYEDIVLLVSPFICGVADINNALSGATFTVELRITNPADAGEYYVINSTAYTFA